MDDRALPQPGQDDCWKCYYGPWEGAELPISSFTQDEIADWDQFVGQELTSARRGAFEQIERFLRANPGTDYDDFWEYQGGAFMRCRPPAAPLADEVPWHQLDREDVRRLATKTLARRLPCNVRQAAARDAGLLFNPLSRRHRRRKGDLSPPQDPWLSHLLKESSTSRATVNREGASKVYQQHRSRPAAAKNSKSMTKNAKDL